MMTHQIDTENARPIKQNPYCAALNEQEFVKKKLKDLQERELIQQLNSL